MSVRSGLWQKNIALLVLSGGDWMVLLDCALYDQNGDLYYGNCLAYATFSSHLATARKQTGQRRLTIVLVMVVDGVDDEGVWG